MRSSRFRSGTRKNKRYARTQGKDAVETRVGDIPRDVYVLGPKADHERRFAKIGDCWPLASERNLVPWRA